MDNDNYKDRIDSADCAMNAVSPYKDAITTAIGQVLLEKTPVVGTLYSIIVKSQSNYEYAKETIFYEKVKKFFGENGSFVSETTDDERRLFCQLVEEKTKQNTGDTLFQILDKCDNANKCEIISKIWMAAIKKQETVESCMRLCKVLDLIPYTDLAQLENYKSPYYDESGSTELLYASGVLKLAIIPKVGSNEENKYQLSSMGLKLLRYIKNDYTIDLDGTNLNKGTKVELDMATEDGVLSIFQK